MSCAYQVLHVKLRFHTNSNLSQFVYDISESFFMTAFEIQPPVQLNKFGAILDMNARGITHWETDARIIMASFSERHTNYGIVLFFFRKPSKRKMCVHTFWKKADVVCDQPMNAGSRVKLNTQYNNIIVSLLWWNDVAAIYIDTTPLLHTFIFYQPTYSYVRLYAVDVPLYHYLRLRESTAIHT